VPAWCAAGLWSLDQPAEAETAAVIAAAQADADAYVLKPQREGGGNNLYGEELQQRLAQVRGQPPTRLRACSRLCQCATFPAPCPPPALHLGWQQVALVMLGQQQLPACAPSNPFGSWRLLVPVLVLQGDEGLAAYILMQRIRPPPQRSILVRRGAWAEADSLSELGVYGTFLRKVRRISWPGCTAQALVHRASAVTGPPASGAPASAPAAPRRLQGDQVLTNNEAGHLVRTKTATSNEGGVAAGFAVLDSPFLVAAAEAGDVVAAGGVLRLAALQ